MSDGILVAAEIKDDYLRSPVDDLCSFYYTMQWAAFFHDQEFTAKDVPKKLEYLRNNLFGKYTSRCFATTQITDRSSLSPLDYGSFLTQCQPVLRAWYLELWGIKGDWEECQSKLCGQDIEATGKVYMSLFSTFALRGVATLAEIVYKHTRDME